MTVHTVLVPSGGGPGCVNLCRSLRMTRRAPRIVACDASPEFLLLAEADIRVPCPRRSDEDAWIAALNRICREHAVEFILPNNSLDGEVLSRRQPEIEAKTFLPSPEAFAIGADKWRSFNAFKDAGLPVPRTWLLRARKDVDRVFAALGKGPMWIRGAGIPGRGIGVASLPARSAEQAAAWVDFWDGWGAMTASEYLDGDNLTWLGLFSGGVLITSQGRMRDAYVIPHVSPSGITGAPAISHTVCRKDINELGLAACLAVDPRFEGPAFVDFKCDATGAPRITEINVGRFGTTHNFYTAAGANFPEIIVSLALGDTLPTWARRFDALIPDLFWIRNLDCGPVLTRKQTIDKLIRTGKCPRLKGIVRWTPFRSGRGVPFWYAGLLCSDSTTEAEEYRRRMWS